MEVVTLTEQAQEHVLRLKKLQPKVRDGLRVKVIGGGCSGLTYKLGWDDITDEDFVHEYDSGLRVIIDPKSANLLQGSVVNYYDDLEKSGFDIKNPNATEGCGCGKSFAG